MKFKFKEDRDTVAFGVFFPRGEYAHVSEETAIRKLQGNSHFVAASEPTRKSPIPTPDDDTKNPHLVPMKATPFVSVNDEPQQDSPVQRRRKARKAK